MGMADDETTLEPTPAPRARQALAGMIDAATLGAPFALYRWRIARSGEGRVKGERLDGWNRVFTAATRLADEQVGSPGSRIVGLRTVDSRTGRRVAFWRSLVVVLAEAATRELSRRAFGVRPPISEAQRAEWARQMQALEDAHPEDGDARREAIARLYEERQVHVRFTGRRMLAGIVAPALINHWLRRRLAPTIVVSRDPAE
jgi:hypothetical protein